MLQSNTPAFGAIAFIDAALSNVQTLLNGVEPGTEILLLDSSKDGIKQISAALASRNSIKSIHIVSHGSPGSLQLGTAQLSLTNFDSYGQQLQQWSAALAKKADILLYGCEVAAGEKGSAFVQQLSQATGANIAASVSLTGNATLGGNWDLEFATGKIETPLAFAPEVRQAYSFVLASFTVNTTDDTIDINPGDGLALDANGKTSLRAAVMEANSDPWFSWISLPAGTYTLTIPPDATPDDAADGDLDILKWTGLQIEGAGAGATIIDANYLDRAFHLLPIVNNNVYIADITIRNGKASNNNGGGGILMEDNSSLTIIDSVLSNNTTSGNTGGGAIRNLGGELRIASSTLTGNTATNTTGTGGAIRQEDGFVSLFRSTLDGNSANQSGGGIRINNGTADISDSTFSDNKAIAGNGGAISIINTSVQAVNVVNSTFSGNTANSPSGDGGAIQINDGLLNLANSTLTLNSATNGGGIRVISGGLAYVRNTLIAGNTAITNPDVSGSFIINANNYTGSTGAWLGPLQDNGGPTKTHALLPGSPAINAGNNADVPADVDDLDFDSDYNEPIPFDQQSGSSYPRIAGGTVDIGAFEYNSAPPVITLTADTPFYGENAPTPTIIDSGATVTDSDSPNFGSGTLTADITVGGTADDRIGISTGSGGFQLDGRIVKYGFMPIGTFTGGIGTDPLVVTFNTNTTPEIVEKLVRNLTYENVSQNPDVGNRTLRFVLSDGGSKSLPVTKDIFVFNHNDFPFVGKLTTLYDGSLNTLPQTQGWFSSVFPPATATVSGGLTKLNTTNSSNIEVGFYSPNLGILDRTKGYTFNFNLQVLSESRTPTADKNGDGKDDSAGFSAIVMSSDSKGIQLEFWEDRIWAQEDGTTQEQLGLEPDSPPPSPYRTLFTQAEGTAWDTKTNLTPYSLNVQGDTYTLSTGNTTILSGKLRDYRDGNPYGNSYDIYEGGNFIYLGDRSASAQSEVALSSVSVINNVDLPNQTVDEDTDLPITGVQFIDVDAGSNDVEVVLKTYGKLTVKDSGLSVIGNGTHSVTLKGSLSQINSNLAAANGLVYQSIPNFSGSNTLTVNVDDLGNSGGGGGLIGRDSKYIPIFVTPVADVPDLNVSDASGNEDASIPLNINLSLVNNPGGWNGEILSVDISGVPTGATLNKGTNLGGGKWTLAEWQLTGLTITPPLHSDADFT
ncbi:MAG TPA: DUF4347 domain-containing protein, partial [Kamptonema sp.]|nr:DUF4347 domain-containing protein [Kamptonema sp.]